MRSFDEPRAGFEGDLRAGARQLLLHALFACVLLRLFLTESVVNLWANYTTEEGSLIEKIHPGSYALIGVCLALLLTQRVELRARELTAVRALLILLATIGVLCAGMAAAGRAGSAGYLVDTYGVACLAGIALFAAPPAWRAALGSTLLVLLVASSVVALGEAALKVRFLPYAADELRFRPTGLMGHPLALGLSNAMAIGFTAATRWPARAKVAAIALLALGALAAGARLAALGAAASVFCVVATTPWPGAGERRIPMKVLALIGLLLSLPVAILLLASLGLLDRFEQGLFDESAMARVSIYGVFDLVGWKDILLGTDLDAIRKLAFERLELEFIESSLVVFVFQFGLLGAAAFVAVLGLVLRRLLRGAGSATVLGTLTFLVVAMGNNTLSAKTPLILMVFILIEAARCAEDARRAS